TGIFDQNRYFDVFIEYAKASPEDILIRITVTNRGPEAAPLHLLPTLWFRNSWIWGCTHEGCAPKPLAERIGPTHQASLGRFLVDAAPGPDGAVPALLFTDNETNAPRIFGYPGATRVAK